MEGLTLGVSIRPSRRPAGPQFPRQHLCDGALRTEPAGAPSDPGHASEASGAALEQAGKGEDRCGLDQLRRLRHLQVLEIAARLPPNGLPNSPIIAPPRASRARRTGSARAQSGDRAAAPD
ncbi:hypothetical protein J2X65_001074 [Ancylobacter sp. 3268]|uniref:hypothetical protein n=1 Tax=Ancylobacter sp. 3268 TaxID=2817752 RepID=UPI0028649C31|nr:hypothetical protein [Ancylobacter sp. 3268]MDR6951725.1 hypothetical protein [Ancylobacter sp. 3268]